MYPFSATKNMPVAEGYESQLFRKIKYTKVFVFNTVYDRFWYRNEFVTFPMADSHFLPVDYCLASFRYVLFVSHFLIDILILH